ncbi:hypothetical protein HPB49_019871 [Dermacentor silvarum]|uniref:Uncharacterized protein n=2 Tax=Dermacentor silvarum TaxID=543639 RepID=A0ACB8DFG3_DERSI|nr:hypothetical protein HPB49_019871 [Dermacentor silvarum]
MSGMSLYGVPMYGSAICGTYGVISYELCARWYQLIAFSPFMFTARRAGQAHADPYSLVQVRDVARLAIQLRYSMLDYVYTQLRLCTTTGHPFLRPLFLEFPSDRTTWRITKQFFFGPALMVAPAVAQGINEVDVYFPNAGFYDFFRYTHVAVQGKNRWKNVVMTEYQTPTYLRAGHIMVVRRPDVTVALTQRNRVSLIVAARQRLVDSDSKENNVLLAQGELCIDSDSSLPKNTGTTVKFNFWKEHVQFGSKYQCYLFKILIPDYIDKTIFF